MPSRVLVSLRVGVSRERAFDAFVREIGAWWRPNPLFRFHPRGTGRVRFTEAGPGARLVEALADGGEHVIGTIDVWEPPERLAFGWRQASFAPGQQTHVEARFEALGEGTRITVEHVGWDTVPSGHVARHGFPDAIFLRRHAEWWEALLRTLGARLEVRR